MPAYDANDYSPPAPVARVTVRHPDNAHDVADVRMLIDTGADATLLPVSVVQTLSLPGTGERYELVGFDGSLKESEAVRATLVFLGKTFRGRFLPVDAEVGIIGRNILNAVRLLLDGPALSWDESRPGRQP